LARVPIVRIGETLLATVQDELYDDDALALQEELSARLEQTGARGVLIDVSVVETVDSYLGRILRDVALGARLLGAHTVVVGIQPAVAVTLVELGLDVKGIHTALNPERGLVRLRGLLAAEDARDRSRVR
jgi:rsbT antagonist protein RsbS